MIDRRNCQKNIAKYTALKQKKAPEHTWEKLYSSLEKEVKEETNSLREIIKHPLKSALVEMLVKDLDYSELFKGSKKRKMLFTVLATSASYEAFILPHELIHAEVNTLTGGQNKEVVVNTLYGGDLVHLINPEIQAKLLSPLTNGYVDVKEYGSSLGKCTAEIAPYMMTPLGIWMIEEGKKRKSLPLRIAGSGIVGSQLGGVAGDFWNIGKTITSETAKNTANLMGFKNFNPAGILNEIPLAIIGLYIGEKICSFTYRAFKSGVKNLGRILSKEDKNTQAEQA